ncbi:tRNA uridine-5-carboxymethylaminomethyl(34) synthesis GTPase MnmE [Primorskyibacter flagellatus]|uniref:tRNA uridine-5-carboxymethylaminomethyl(34) synthesis GTPase MnmE n=1 Tax=Primorskyibacter flagellatus TaxID=1387277 RepID=UPI003A94B936
MDTIYALASAQGKAGVAVVRISGPDAFDAATILCGSLPAPRQHAVRRIKTASGEYLDEALVLVFPEGASFTAEAVVELHLHGSIAVVSAVLRELSELGGLRLAEPGEFTRRALENGRLDLAQVEGLADLIEAETEAQRVQALRSLSGDLGQVVGSWRTKLIRASALLEAVIDFSDEDVPEDVGPEVLSLIADITHSLQIQLDGFKSAERIRSGFEVAIIGAPNVGKSTLLNALAGRDAAITSEVAGTTRDVIEVSMELDGLPVTLLDTAGLRETDDIVESLGIERAIQRASAADLRVLLFEDSEPSDIALKDDDISVASKADHDGVGVSGLTGRGVDALIKRITSVLTLRSKSAGLATRERHRVAMRETLSALNYAETLVSQNSEQYDIAAEELRVAIRHLEKLIGRVDVEMLLDEIFSSFCLGK